MGLFLVSEVTREWMLQVSGTDARKKNEMNQLMIQKIRLTWLNLNL